MANFGDFKGSFDKIISILKRIDNGVNCATCTNNVTSAGSGISVPAGFKAITIVKTNGTGTVNITLSDLSVYHLTAQNETFSDIVPTNGKLPAYTIATADAGTWKWHGIN